MSKLRLAAFYIAALAIAFGAGAFLGYRYHEGRAAVKENAEVAAVVERGNEQTAADNRLVERQAEAATKARVVARKVKTKGIIDATLKANPACAPDAVSYGLLVSAIRAANGVEADDSGGVPDDVRTDAGADGADGRGGQGVAVRGG